MDLPGLFGFRDHEVVPVGVSLWDAVPDLRANVLPAYASGPAFTEAPLARIMRHDMENWARRPMVAGDCCNGVGRSEGYRVERLTMTRRSAWLRHSARLAARHEQATRCSTFSAASSPPASPLSMAA